MSDRPDVLVRDGRVETVGARTVTVRLATAAACARCARGEGCGFGFAVARADESRLVLRRPEGFRPTPGDGVRVALERRGLGAAAAAVYGIPLAGLLAGSALATLLGLGEGAAIALVSGAFAAALPLAHRAARRIGASDRCHPRLLPAATAPVCADA